MAREIVERGWTPDLVLCSPARRTQETFRKLLEEADNVQMRLEDSLYGAAAQGLMNLLHDLGDGPRSVMIIGHNPGLETLASRLAATSSDTDLTWRLEEKYPTAAIAVFDVPATSWAELAVSRVQLVDFVRPRDLE